MTDFDPHGAFFARNFASGLVMDVQGGSSAENTPVIAYARKDVGVENQLWRFTLAKPGAWMICTDMDTGFVLTATGLEPGLVVAPPGETLEGQLWSLVSTDERGYWYVQSSNPTMVIASDGQQGGTLTTPERSYTEFSSQAWGFAPHVL